MCARVRVCWWGGTCSGRGGERILREVEGAVDIVGAEGAKPNLPAGGEDRR